METPPLKKEVKEVKAHQIIVKPHDPAVSGTHLRLFIFQLY